MVMARRGFTLMEVLVVCMIILILVSLGLVGIGLLRESLKRTRTESILATVGGALAMAGQRGGTVASAEHPLAGSAAWPASRPAFKRQGSAAPLSLTAGTIVTQTGEALRAADPLWVPATDRGRLLLPDDRFSGGGTDAWELPLLFGLRREQIGVLGSADSRISTWRAVAQPNSRTDLNSDGFTDTAALADERSPLRSVTATDSTLTATDDRVTTTGRALTSALAEVLADLAKNSAVITTLPTEGTLICNGLAVSLGTTAAWEPGTVLFNGAWHRYRLLGTCVYDGWGREILCSLSAGGAIRLMSAGKDGVFVWHPGADGILQTGAVDSAPSGDDRDGSLDNILNNRE